MPPSGTHRRVSMKLMWQNEEVTNLEFIATRVDGGITCLFELASNLPWYIIGNTVGNLKYTAPASELYF